MTSAPDRDRRETAEGVLRRAGLTPTKRRVAVLRALADRERPLTVQNLHVELRRDGPGPGLTTVYRTLTTLAARRVVHRFACGNAIGYRWCGAMPHSHVICRRCALVAELPAGTAGDRTGRLAAARGFALDGDITDVLGVCRACRESAVRGVGPRP